MDVIPTWKVPKEALADGVFSYTDDRKLLLFPQDFHHAGLVADVETGRTASLKLAGFNWLPTRRIVVAKLCFWLAGSDRPIKISASAAFKKMHPSFYCFIAENQIVFGGEFEYSVVPYGPAEFKAGVSVAKPISQNTYQHLLTMATVFPNKRGMEYTFSPDTNTFTLHQFGNQSVCMSFLEAVYKRRKVFDAIVDRRHPNHIFLFTVLGSLRYGDHKIACTMVYAFLIGKVVSQEIIDQLVDDLISLKYKMDLSK
jgi:hypothetical protein